MEKHMNLQSVGVLGAGQMGNGIAQVVAAQGIAVQLVDIQTSALEKALATISSSCDRLIKKEAMTEAQKKDLLGRIKTSTNLSDFKNCNFVIEAVAEYVDLKLKIIRELHQISQPNAILCINTSNISIT